MPHIILTNKIPLLRSTIFISSISTASCPAFPQKAGHPAEDGALAYPIRQGACHRRWGTRPSLQETAYPPIPDTAGCLAIASQEAHFAFQPRKGALGNPLYQGAIGKGTL